MKDCSNLVQVLKGTVPDVPREFSNVIINGVTNASSMVSSAIRNYGSVYGQNQMLEYSTDGKISDVTSQFQGRAAISESVLSQLSNDLTILKDNYDKAWDTLPSQTETFTTTLSEELSASFSLNAETKAPLSRYTLSTEVLRDEEIGIDIVDLQNNRTAIARLSITTNPTVVQFINVPSSNTTLRSIMRAGLSGTIILNDVNSNVFSALSVWQGGDAGVTVMIYVIRRIVTIIVTFKSQVIAAGNFLATSSLQNLSVTPLFNQSYTGDAEIFVPNAINGAIISELAQSGQLAYAVPTGETQFEVSKTVTKDVEYSVTYNTIPNESRKIQDLIDAIP